MTREAPWLTVRFAPAENARLHTKYVDSLAEFLARLEDVTIRVRHDLNPIGLAKFQQNAGCDAEHFFEIHPDDYHLLGATRPQETSRLCSHVIEVD